MKIRTGEGKRKKGSVLVSEMEMRRKKEEFPPSVHLDMFIKQILGEKEGKDGEGKKKQGKRIKRRGGKNAKVKQIILFKHFDLNKKQLLRDRFFHLSSFRS